MHKLCMGRRGKLKRTRRMIEDEAGKVGKTW
jgi:hypothetical protein